MTMSLEQSIACGRTRVVQVYGGLPVTARALRRIKLGSCGSEHHGEFCDLCSGQVDRQRRALDGEGQLGITIIRLLTPPRKLDAIARETELARSFGVGDRGHDSNSRGQRLFEGEEEAVIGPIVRCEDRDLSPVSSNPRRSVDHLGNHALLPLESDDHDA